MRILIAEDDVANAKFLSKSERLLLHRMELQLWMSL